MADFTKNIPAKMKKTYFRFVGEKRHLKFDISTFDSKKCRLNFVVEPWCGNLASSMQSRCFERSLLEIWPEDFDFSSLTQEWRLFMKNAFYCSIFLQFFAALGF